MQIHSVVRTRAAALILQTGRAHLIALAQNTNIAQALLTESTQMPHTMIPILGSGAACNAHIRQLVRDGPLSRFRAFTTGYHIIRLKITVASLAKNLVMLRHARKCTCKQKHTHTYTHIHTRRHPPVAELPICCSGHGLEHKELCNSERNLRNVTFTAHSFSTKRSESMIAKDIHDGCDRL